MKQCFQNLKGIGVLARTELTVPLKAGMAISSNTPRMPIDYKTIAMLAKNIIG